LELSTAHADREPERESKEVFDAKGEGNQKHWNTSISYQWMSRALSFRNHLGIPRLLHVHLGNSRLRVEFDGDTS
jgi:hypothetical protein